MDNSILFWLGIYITGVGVDLAVIGFLSNKKVFINRFAAVLSWLHVITILLITAVSVIIFPIYYLCWQLRSRATGKTKLIL